MRNNNPLFYDNEKRPEIVCLCGSSRFIDDYQLWQKKLAWEGHIALSIGCQTTQANEFMPEELKEKLDELHLRKIDLADRVVVLNKYGYIGESTEREIAHCCLQGKPIYFAFNTFPEEMERVGLLLKYYANCASSQEDLDVPKLIQAVLKQAEEAFTNGDYDSKVAAYKAMMDIED